jgi:hypothetical protein
MSSFINLLQNLFNELQELQKFDKSFCSIFPPGIDSFTSVLVNLPIILLWIISLPPRTFLCLLTSIGQVNVLGVIINLIPPLTMFCSVCPGTSSSCFQCSNYCQNNAECITLPQSYINLCQQTKQYFSILNEIFCLLGYVLLSLILPFTQIINFILSFTGHQICLSLNPNNCIPGGNS